MNIDAATVVAEIDGQIIKKDDFNSAKLSAGQKIELIRIVGGG
jgi:thiamine biosynthesis protein ThiS